MDERHFMESLASCHAYVGSAGFESICEAFYLGKPVLAIPTEGQFEQTLNAWDAERAGAARAGSYADLEDWWGALKPPDAERVASFREWVGRAPELFVHAIEDAVRDPG